MANEIDIITQLHERLDRRPFHGFAMVMADGEKYLVTREHQVAVGGNIIVFLGPNSPSIWLAPKNLTKIEDLQPTEEMGDSYGEV